MQLQVQPELPAFAATRDAVAKVRATTQAAAASYLCTLTATQFERLAIAATAEVADDVRTLLVRLALAENLAEQAAAAPPDEAQQLAGEVSELAGTARETIHELAAAQQEAPPAEAAEPKPTDPAPVAAAGAMDSTTEQDAHAAAPAEPAEPVEQPKK
jgi:hypothetical protein